MSSSRLNLKSPPVLAAVVVLAAAVTVLNIKTFGSKSPRRKSPPVQVRVQEYPVLPADLDQVVQQALQNEGLPPRPGSARPRVSVERDPFQRSGHAEPAAGEVAQIVEAESTLRCAAVLLGGKRPVALIDGAACTLGSKVRGMTIVNIEYNGVQLRTSDGDLFHLPLVPQQTVERNGP